MKCRYIQHARPRGLKNRPSVSRLVCLVGMSALFNALGRMWYFSRLMFSNLIAK